MTFSLIFSSIACDGFLPLLPCTKNCFPCLLDDTVAYKLVETESFKGVLRVIDIPLTTEAYAIAVKKGNKDLLEKINKALKELEDEGKIKELFEKWEIDQE